MVFLMKIALMGDEGVGKRSLLECYGGGFHSTYMMTIGADFANVYKEIANKMVKFQIWNLAPQTHYGANRTVYYLGCLGGLLLYDVTRPETFRSLSKWVQEYWRSNTKGIIPVVILGNKVDLRDRFPKAVTPEVGQTFCEKLSELTIPHGFETRYLEISVKRDQNVSKAL